jgi:predicted methyltransferase
VTVQASPDPTFDSAPFVEIGESDRMTLKFRKPE